MNKCYTFQPREQKNEISEHTHTHQILFIDKLKVKKKNVKTKALMIISTETENVLAKFPY